MKKINIKVDKPEVTAKEAESYKDFQEVLLRSNVTGQSNGFSGLTITGGVILFLSLIVGSLLYINSDSINKKQVVVEQLKKGISRPFPEVEVVYETFKLDVQKKSEIMTEKGTFINVPKNAFIDSVGVPVSGEVSLKYKELRDMTDVFLSGVPMVYDSVGREYHFQSAGMFEIRGEQDGLPVYIAPDKVITVDFASDYSGDQFNIYKYDIDKNNWVYRHKDIPMVEQELNVINDNEPVKTKGESADKLIVQPVLATNSIFKIALDVLPEEFPEISLYTNVKFQLIGNQYFDASLALLEWDFVKVSKTEDTNYLLSFEKGKRVEKFYCTPVFESEDFDQAMLIFEAQVKKANDVKAQNRAIKIGKSKKLKSEKQSQRNTLMAFRDRKKYNSEAEITKAQVFRVFQVESFGFYNSDCPKNLPQGKMLAVNLKDKEQKEDTLYLQFGKAFLVEKNSNSLYTYYGLSNFSYNPKSDNMLWTVTKENMLAILSYDNFDEMSVSGKEAVFEMELIDVKEKTEDEIKELLALDE